MTATGSLSSNSLPFVHRSLDDRRVTLIIPYFSYGTLPTFDAPRIIFLVIAFLILVPLGIFWAVIVWFMVPVMYRQRQGPLAAFAHVLRLLARHPGPFILYVLFVFVLVIAGLMISCVLTCVTCCLAALPYIGTVILLTAVCILL